MTSIARCCLSKTYQDTHGAGCGRLGLDVMVMVMMVTTGFFREEEEEG